MGRRGGDGGRCRLTSKVLRNILAYYREALKQLPAEEFAPLLTAGACFGLLDPVSNIIVNTTTASTSSPKNKRKRSQQMVEGKDREKVLSQVARGIAKRSLDGLVTFLVCHFRCLHRCEALRYLRLAKADLIVAVHLIDMDRRVTSSTTTNPCSTSFRVALKCAAISAKHPCPDTLTAVWLSLATSPPEDLQQQLLELSSNPRVKELLLALPQPARLGHLHNPRQLKSVRHFQKKRSRDSAKEEVPLAPELPEWLVCQLLDMINRVYLKAIARFPKGALRVTHHRGLLKAGHCFGPMDDPVSNILLNAIWYDTAFPPQEEFLADMLLTRSLARIQARSAAGLIDFLCTRFPDLSRQDAVFFLLEADANLHDAIARAQRGGHDASGSLEEAYRAAALAAWHPDPEALAEFTLSTVHMLPPAVLLHQRTSDRSLTDEEIQVISASLEDALESPSSCSRRSMNQVPKLSKQAAHLVTRHQKKFDDDQFFFRRIVEAALKSVWPGYQLHVICGVNERITENGKHGYYDLRDGHPYCHINFLARPRHSPSAAPMLFFAECSNDDKDTEVLSCCAVDALADDGRCFHCERQATKIVHPSFVRFRGCDTDFEEMARGKGITITNGELIIYGRRRTEVSWLPEEDCVYFDPRWDTKIAELVNKAGEKKPAKPITA